MSIGGIFHLYDFYLTLFCFRVQNTNAGGETTTEELQYKLTLKKKIWTGVSPEASRNNEHSRPLSWGMPPIGKRKEEKHKDENEALLT